MKILALRVRKSYSSTTKHIDKTKVVFDSTIADGNKEVQVEEDEIKYSMLATINKDRR